ncbi:MAG: hypothetical protein WBF75_25835 [Pseudonocardiaceae bacterium]
MGRPTVGITSFVVPSAGGVVVTTVAGGVVVTTEVSLPGFDGGGGATRLHALSATAHVTAPQNATIAPRPTIVRDSSAGWIPWSLVVTQLFCEDD